MWLRGKSTALELQGLGFDSHSGARTWVAGSVPRLGCAWEATNGCVSRGSLSPPLPSLSLKINGEDEQKPNNNEKAELCAPSWVLTLPSWEPWADPLPSLGCVCLCRVRGPQLSPAVTSDLGRGSARGQDAGQVLPWGRATGWRLKQVLARDMWFLESGGDTGQFRLFFEVVVFLCRRPCSLKHGGRTDGGEGRDSKHTGGQPLASGLEGHHHVSGKQTLSPHRMLERTAQRGSAARPGAHSEEAAGLAVHQARLSVHTAARHAGAEDSEQSGCDRRPCLSSLSLDPCHTPADTEVTQ